MQKVKKAAAQLDSRAAVGLFKNLKNNKNGIDKNADFFVGLL